MRTTKPKSNLKLASAVLIALSVLAGALSSEAAPTIITSPKPVAKVPQKRWTLPMTLETSSTLHAQDAYERQAMTSLSLAPSYLISKGLKLSAATMIYKEETGAGNSGVDNTLIALSLAKPLTKETSWFGTLGAIAPTNEELRDQTSYQGAARLGGGLNFANLIFDSSLRYVLNYTRNFHEFSQTASGGFNVRQTLVQTLEYTLPFNDQWSLQTVFSYTYGLTYQDDMRTKFYAGADINWSVMKNLIITAGTSNEGNALKPNGSDSNINFYDDTSSVVKLGITYVL